jgi:hypothetical protein
MALEVLNNPALQVRKGPYMTVEIGLPRNVHPVVQISYGVPHSPLTRQEAELLARYIMNLPAMIRAIESLNRAFDGEEYDNDTLIALLENATIS